MAFPNIADIFRQDSVQRALPVGGVSGRNSELILSVRGTFYNVIISENSSPGMYAIDELNRFMAKQNSSLQNGSAQQATETPPVLITGVDFNQMDITSEMPCLNNVKVFYSFGQNFGQVQIAGEVLLGPVGQPQQHNRGFKLIRDFFWQHRVSVTRRPIAVSLASESYFVYLKGLKVGQVDPNYHIMPFMLFGTLLDINREDANRINPRSTVITTGDIDSSALISAIKASKPEELSLTKVFTDIAATPDNGTTSSLNVAQKGAGVPVDPSTDVSKMDNAGKIASAKAVLMKQGLPSDDPDVLTYKQLNATRAYLATNGTRLESQVNNSKAGNAPGDVLVSTTPRLDTVVNQTKPELDAAQAEVAERIVRKYNHEEDPEVRPFSEETAAALTKFGIDPVTAATSSLRPNQWKTVSESPLAGNLRDAAWASGISPEHPGPLSENESAISQDFAKEYDRKLKLQGNH